MSQFLGPVSYLGDVSGVGPSGSIWNDLPDNIQDRNVGVLIDWNPANGFGYVDATGAVTGALNIGGYASGFYASAGGAVVDGGLAGGSVKIGSDGDNEGVGFIPQSGAVKITSGQGKLWFEAAIAVSSISATGSNAFVGLMEPVTPAVTTIPVTSSDIVVDKNIIGFAKLIGAPTALSATYKNSGQTVQVSIAAAQTLVAATVYKVGFKYDPRAFGAAKALKWYINGVEQTTYVTATQIAAATFPNDTFLGPVWGIMNNAGTNTDTCTLKFLKCAQLF